MAQNILLIQSDPSAARAVRDALINSSDGPFEVEWLTCCSEGLKRLTEDARKANSGTPGIAAVLVDLLLPDSDGVVTFDQPVTAETFAQLLRRNAAPARMANGHAKRKSPPRSGTPHRANAVSTIAGAPRNR